MELSHRKHINTYITHYSKDRAKDICKHVGTVPWSTRGVSEPIAGLKDHLTVSRTLRAQLTVLARTLLATSFCTAAFPPALRGCSPGEGRARRSRRGRHRRSALSAGAAGAAGQASLQRGTAALRKVNQN